MEVRGPFKTTMIVSAWIASVVLFVAVPAPAEDAPTPDLAPLNPAFVEYIDTADQRIVGETTAEGYGLGMVPDPVDLSHMTGQKLAFPRGFLAAPTSYDLRAVPGKLPPVQNQGACGSCWSFAAFASLESCLLTAESWDFSEMDLICSHGFDYAPCDGGNHKMATAYLARWDGPVTEACYPYNPPNCTVPRPSCAVQKHLQQAIFLPDRTGPLDNENIKQAVMTYGAVATSMYWSDPYYKSSTYSYYYSGSTGTNHGISIVGWDDNYDRTRFASLPPDNGAFIVRNSWGSAWGQGGYFYISYYDGSSFRNCAVFSGAGPAANYGRVYQYDPLGWVSSTGYGSETAWCANIFTAAAVESLAAVSLYAASPNSPYALYVYRNVTSTPRTGTLATSQSGTLTYAGYQTIPLTTPVSVTSGQKFSVVVKLTTPGYNYPVAMEYPASGYASAATANAGESWMSFNGNSWTDLTSYYTNANACLKAFAAGSDVTPPTVLTINRKTPSQPVTCAASVVWTVTFSESVVNVDASDFEITRLSGGIGGYSITSVSGSGAGYDVTVNTGGGNGELRLDLKSGTNVQDAAGNPCAGYASGQSYIIDKRILTNAATVTVPEGGTNVFQVRLAGVPTGNVTVAVSRSLGDADITVQSGSSLTFTPSNWSTDQSVTLAAAQDSDRTNGQATIECQASGLTSAAVTATEQDDDVPGDLDGDSDVDGSDFGVFGGCFNGTGNAVSGGCIDADLNGDLFVDGMDFGIFSSCFNGSGNPPACPS